MKNIKKLLSQQRNEILPGNAMKDIIKQKIRLEQKQTSLVYAHNGQQKGDNALKTKLLVCSIVLILVLLVGIFIPILLNKRTNKEREKSCGCIITKDNKVLLIKQTKGHWGFPKGHVEKNETEIETAIREVKEETNLDVEIDANKRYTMEYVTDKGKLKQVVLFIAKCIGGEIKAQECEVNDIKWLDFDEAIETITYDNTRELFKEILKERKI